MQSLIYLCILLQIGGTALENAPQAFGLNASTLPIAAVTCYLLHTTKLDPTNTIISFSVFPFWYINYRGSCIGSSVPATVVLR